MWGYGVKEVEPYVEFIGRDILFREAVLGVLGIGKGSKNEPTNLQDSFCVACKAAKKDIDCNTCSKSVREIKEVK